MRKESAVTQRTSRKGTETRSRKTFSSSLRLCASARAFPLLIVLLITSCFMPVDEAGYQPSPGMGAVTLNFANEVARATILPGATIDTFAQFELQFTSSGGVGNTAVGKTVYRLNTVKDTVPPAEYTRNAPVELVPGTYNLTVVAYLLEAATPETSPPDSNNKPAAVWSSPAPIPVANGDTLPVSVMLTAYDPAAAGDGSDDGTFEWDITENITATLTYAHIVITRIVPVPPSPTDIDLLNDSTNTNTPQWNGTTNLAPGYYYADIELKIDDNNIVRTFHHILHISQNLTSTFTYTFTDNHIAL